ncbi:hypothetical protein SAMN02910275_01319 [Butyrivibrio sp. INlla18]|uniref:type VII secretion target n=1 Tax=Butyrivibrio sp. INlla18 TaxID=1520806 RepID=UPI000889F2BB|nr:hypothetical protein [Butyrivibrio sp. INlla18]SDA57348.1 hypothetical protein SAMN02910275_01319 [Butyrivibrio sp. INlla18]
MAEGLVSQAEISNLSRRIAKVENMAAQMNNVVQNIDNSLNAMNGSLGDIKSDLARLSDDFQKMFNEQKRTAALQHAATELVRVRQELEQNFGNYKNVRETMLGVLQASDLALVKKTTISRVSEEIMLSTPEYWLAPCLVAVSAWIANDRDLAERAIKEACRRDEEKTAITMALICRRNNRTQTCYEWLSIYFAKQDAADFSEGSFAYIDAYVNGIFGPDERHMCDDYITKWLNEIKGNGVAFEFSQEQMWKSYCEKFKLDVSGQYPSLASYSSEFPQINEYMGRIGSVDSISSNFHEIVNAYVDQDSLKKKVDKNLISLISRYDGKEEPLRNEERFLQKIKDFDGDTEKARDYMRQEEMLKREQRLNLVERMASTILTDEATSPSQRKTAVSFLRGYIRKGYNTYIEEKKPEFPTEVTVNVNGWSGKTSDGSNTPQLMTEFEQYANALRQSDIATANTNKPKVYMGGAIASGVAALLGAIVIHPVIGLMLLAAAGYLAFKMFKEKKTIENNIALINSNYDQLITNGKSVIAGTVDEWVRAKNVVTQFEQQPAREIIA